MNILVVAAGPAGMAAALAAAPSGAAITVLDDNPAPGGQIWRDGPNAQLPPAALRMREALARHGNVQVLCGTRVVATAQAPRALLLEDAQRSWVQAYDRLILCTGARELLLPFPGWTLPGVTGAGGLQALIKAGLPVRGERIVVAGSGPLLLAAAATARKAGAHVLRIAEQASLGSVAGFAAQLWRWPAKARQAAGLFDMRYRAASRVVAAHGMGQVESVELFEGGKRRVVACDRVACGFGLVPNVELGRLLGCATKPAAGMPALEVDELQATSVDGVYAAGECTGIGGSEAALVQGAITGHAVTGDVAAAHRLGPERARWQAFADRLHRSFALNPGLRQLATPDTLVCRCEDVPHAALAACTGWTEAKLHTRCGMGACQGRVCGAAAQFLFGWTPTAPRVPLSPARIGTLALPLREAERPLP